MWVPHGTTDRVTRGIRTVQTDDMTVVRTYMWLYDPNRMRHVSCTDDEVEIQSAVQTNHDATHVMYGR